MPRDEPEPRVAETAEALRELPNRWDDRRGRELDCLSSDERAAIQKRRLECLSTAGRLTIKAILDFKCLRDLWLAELYDRAAWARETERTKPYQRAVIVFLGMFIKWCREHADLLPPDMPALSPLNCHVSGFKPDDVAREDFAGNCQAIASLLLETSPTAEARGTRSLGLKASEDDQYEWARQVELVRATNQVIGEGTLGKGVLSRACSDGHVETNGKTGRAVRVRVVSFLRWVSRQLELPKYEEIQIRNAVIGEITSRNS